MPVFTIQTPRGDSVDIDAPDQATALSGAQTWDMEDYATSEANRLGVNPDIAVKMLRQESSSNPYPSPSSAGAIGPMQLMPGTAQDLGVDPHDPYQNITGGLTYYKQQRDHFGNDALALAAYNAGPGSVVKHGGIPPFQQTQDYVAAILGPQEAQNPSGVANPAAKPQTGAQQAPQGSQTPDALDGYPEVYNKDTGKPYTAAVSRGFKALMAAGQLDPNATPGSKAFPRGWTPGFQAGPGEWFVDQDGSLKQVAPLSGADQAKDVGLSALSGLGKDAAGVADTVFGASPAGAVLGALRTAATLAGGGAPSAAPSAPFSRATAPLLHTPQTTAGRYAEVAGENLPNAFLPGGAARRLASVVLPTAAQKGAQDAATSMGATPGQAAAAGMAGALFGQLGAGMGVKLPQRLPQISPEDLRAQASALYTELRNRGVTFTKGAVQSLNDGLIDLLKAEDPSGSMAGLGPHRDWAANVAAQMAADPTVENLDRVRSNMQKAIATPTATTDPNALRIGANMVGELDNFMGAVARRPTLMTTTNPAEAPRVQQILTQARDTWRRLRNVETINNLAESAGIQNATSHMGGNLQNMTARKLRTFIDPSTNKSLAGLSPDEMAQLRRTVIGTPLTETLKVVGNLSPHKGLGAVLGLEGASHLGVVPAAIMGMIGYGANRAGAMIQRSNLDRLVRGIASGVSPSPGGLTYTPGLLDPFSPAALVALRQQQAQQPQTAR